MSSNLVCKPMHSFSRLSTAPSARALAGSLQRPARALVRCTSSGTADNAGAFIEQFTLRGADSGPLSSLTVAVKDMFDIKGHKTGFGNPVWLGSHGVADHTAPAVQALLVAGATIVGKTHMDEMAYSLNGANAHYGTPVNPAASRRLPGGSSSGSAAAVASGQADIGLGSDTGGSIRVPASYCGLCGIRTTHGRVSLQHARPLAPSFDTVGWLTRDALTLQSVGAALLDSYSAHPLPSPPRWLVAKDAFDLATPFGAAQAIYESLAGGSFSAVTRALGHPSEVEVAAGLEEHGLGTLASWAEVFRVLQASEVWQQHGEWVCTRQPKFGPGIAERFHMASRIQPQEVQEAGRARTIITQHLLKLLGNDGVLALPSAPGAAPLIDAVPDAAADAAWRVRSLSLTCIAALAGLPQVSLPVARVAGAGGAPVGLGLIGPRGSDEALMQLGPALMAATKTDQESL